jgi:hypothetical protein
MHNFRKVGDNVEFLFVIEFDLQSVYLHSANCVKMKNAVCGMLRRVALVRIDVLEESSASIISVRRIAEIGPKLSLSSNRRPLRKNITKEFVTEQTPKNNMKLKIKRLHVESDRQEMWQLPLQLSGTVGLRHNVH